MIKNKLIEFKLYVGNREEVMLKAPVDKTRARRSITENRSKLTVSRGVSPAKSLKGPNGKSKPPLSTGSQNTKPQSKPILKPPGSSKR